MLILLCYSQSQRTICTARLKIGYQSSVFDENLVFLPKTYVGYLLLTELNILIKREIRSFEGDAILAREGKDLH